MRYIKDILNLQVFEEEEITYIRCKSYPGKVSGFKLFGINFCKKVASKWKFSDGIDDYTEEELVRTYHCWIDKDNKCAIKKPYIAIQYGIHDYDTEKVYFEHYREAQIEAEKLAMLFNLKKIDYDKNTLLFCNISKDKLLHRYVNPKFYGKIKTLKDNDR